MTKADMINLEIRQRVAVGLAVALWMTGTTVPELAQKLSELNPRVPVKQVDHGLRLILAAEVPDLDLKTIAKIESILGCEILQVSGQLRDPKYSRARKVTPEGKEEGHGEVE